MAFAVAAFVEVNLSLAVGASGDDRDDAALEQFTAQGVSIVALGRDRAPCGIRQLRQQQRKGLQVGHVACRQDKVLYSTPDVVVQAFAL